MKKAYACALGQLTWSWFRIFGKMEDSLVSIFFLNFKNWNQIILEPNPIFLLLVLRLMVLSFMKSENLVDIFTMYFFAPPQAQFLIVPYTMCKILVKNSIGPCELFLQIPLLAHFFLNYFFFSFKKRYLINLSIFLQLC